MRWETEFPFSSHSHYSKLRLQINYYFHSESLSKEYFNKEFEEGVAHAHACEMYKERII